MHSCTSFFNFLSSFPHFAQFSISLLPSFLPAMNFHSRVCLMRSRLAITNGSAGFSSLSLSLSVAAPTVPAALAAWRAREVREASKSYEYLLYSLSLDPMCRLHAKALSISRFLLSSNLNECTHTQATQRLLRSSACIVLALACMRKSVVLLSA